MQLMAKITDRMIRITSIGIAPGLSPRTKTAIAIPNPPAMPTPIPPSFAA